MLNTVGRRAPEILVLDMGVGSQASGTGHLPVCLLAEAGYRFLRLCVLVQPL